MTDKPNNKKVKFPLSLALSYYEEIEPELKSHCEEITKAGSVLREENYVSDIEIVTVEIESKVKQKTLFDFQDQNGKSSYRPSEKLEKHIKKLIEKNFFSYKEKNTGKSNIASDGVKHKKLIIYLL